MSTQMDKPKASTQRVSFASKLDNSIDLIEVIGGSWPGVIDHKFANETASCSTQTPANLTTNSSKIARNKSLNPVSHLISGRKIMRTQPKNEIINNNSASTSTNKNIPVSEEKIFDGRCIF